MLYGGESLKKKKRKKRADKFIIYLAFIFIMTLGSFCLLKSSLFDVSKVEINGNKDLIKNQIIIFSCTEREQKILDNLGIEYNLVEI